MHYFAIATWNLCSWYWPQKSFSMSINANLNIHWNSNLIILNYIEMKEVLKSSLIIRSGPFPQLCDTQKRDAQKCKLPIAFNKRRNLVAFWIMGRKSWQGTNRGIACSRRWKYLWSKQMNAINLNSVYQSFFIAVKCFLRNHCFWHLFVPREVFNGCSHYFSFVAKPVFHWDNNLTLSF